MTVLILGASLKPDRYAYMALNDLLDYGHAVLAVGNRAGEIRGVQLTRDLPKDQPIDTVTLYLGPDNQEDYYSYLKALKPRRVIFNPGTENKELETELEAEGIEVLEACTLVMLRTNQF